MAKRECAHLRFPDRQQPRRHPGDALLEPDDGVLAQRAVDDFEGADLAA